mgnify:CR=1 FL=1
MAAVSGLNATDKKMPMYEMPLIYVFGVGASIYCIGVLGNGILSLAFCPEMDGTMLDCLRG